MSTEFHTVSSAKWILVGEHAVIRGHGAIVYPYKDKHLALDYYADTAELKVNCVSAIDLSSLFLQALKQGCKLLEKDYHALTGRFVIANHIPIGSGLGASAALCVALTRWFIFKNYIDPSRLQEFAQELEHVFHLRSSGLDIAGVCAEEGVYFKEGSSEVLKVLWQPKWRLSYCGFHGNTADCVKQVLEIHRANPAYAKQLDLQMAEAVSLARLALEHNNPNSKALLQKAISLAYDCFLQWGLVNSALAQHIDALMREGALAAKPTGSGAGGYVVSLWP
jgi:mevalonate kinase